MDQDKKLFRLDLTLAVEASSADEAYEVLINDETLKQIRVMITNSQGDIKEMFHRDDQEPIIN